MKWAKKNIKLGCVQPGENVSIFFTNTRYFNSVQNNSSNTEQVNSYSKTGTKMIYKSDPDMDIVEFKQELSDIEEEESEN